MELNIPNQRAELPPHEVLARIKALLIPLRERRRKLNRMVYVFLGGGVLLAAVITLVLFLIGGEVSFWGVPALLLGALFAWFYRRMCGAIDVQIKALEMAEDVTRQKGESA